MSQNKDEFARELAASIIKPLSNNFVERPWGGTRIRELKGLCPLPDQVAIGGAGLGESFEIAAFDADDEARRYPSRVRLADGSIVTLASLLRSYGEALLGERWLRTHGPCVPLLPKFLDIRELLSVQGHPPGLTEVYVVIDAEPGATIRLGFKATVDRDALRRELLAGRRAQLELIELLRRDASQALLHGSLARWFAARSARVGSVLPEIEPMLASRDAAASVAALESLKRCYWRMLDAMNEIAVVPGQIIHNANPPRCLRRSGRAPAAEVHALGNPAGREIIALEIRKPGPTLRAWDHVRFPLRDVDVDAALDVLNLDATDPSEFVVEPVPVPGSAHTAVSVDGAYFRVDHLTPPSGSSVAVSDAAAHCLHNIAARVELEHLDGRPLGYLERGESALVPAPVDRYRLMGRGNATHVVKVSLR